MAKEGAVVSKEESEVPTAAPALPRSSRSVHRMSFVTLAILLAGYVVLSHFQLPLPLPLPQFFHCNHETRRIVAVGDIHGDFDHLSQILEYAGIIDSDSNWSGGHTTFVQTGDILDRGLDTVKLYHFFDRLRAQAARAGGRVVSLLGNHEIMNSLLDWRYVTPEEVKSFGGGRLRHSAVTSGWLGQTWRANYSATARVAFGEGDAAASFVHGGIVPEYLTLLNSSEPVDSMNALARSILDFHTDTSTPAGLPPTATDQQRLFWSGLGPMWNRTYALEEEDVICPLAASVTQSLNVRHLVMAHTPFLEGIQSRCNGSVFLIDTGNSHVYGGKLSSLEILYNPTTQSETVSALYAETQERVVLHQS